MQDTMITRMNEVAVEALAETEFGESCLSNPWIPRLHMQMNQLPKPLTGIQEL